MKHLSQKRTNKAISLLLILIMVMALVACSGSGTGDAKPAAPAAQTDAKSDVPAAQTGTKVASTDAPAEEKTNGYVGISGGGSKAVYSTKDTVNYRLNADLSTIDPHRTNSTGNERIVEGNLYEGLWRIDMFNGKTEVNLCLAESYEYLDDAQTQMQVHLRKGVKFHNGEEMKAADVVWSLNRVVESGFNEVAASFIDSVEEVDEYTVLIKLKFAYSAILRVLASTPCSIMSKSFGEANADSLDRMACGTGPFVFKEWIAGDSITCEAFPDYWRGEAAIKHVNFVIIADNSTYLIALENGQVDTSNAIGSADAEYIKNNSELGYDTSSTGSGGRSILFNCSKGVFADARMRRAVAMAIDRESVWITAYDSTGYIGYTTMSTSLPEYPADFQPLPYDPEAAAALVKECYPDGITINMPTIDNDQYKRATVCFQEQLAKIGININIDLMTRAAWNELCLTNSNFEITYWAVMNDYEDADAILYKFHSRNLNGGGNFMCYSNPEMDKLLDEGRITPAGAERNEIYRKVLEIMKEDAVVVSVHCSQREVAFNKNLKGVKAVPEQKYFIYDYWWEEA